MKRLTYIFTIVILTILNNKSFGQHTDSTQAIGGITRDTFYIIHENIPKSKFWGNSWYVATSYNLSKTNEFDLNIGRTYGSSFCGGAGCNYVIRSWGLGYGLTNKREEASQIIKAFWEYTIFYLPPVGIRADYIYDISSNSHYLRPSVGISFFRFDIFYGYSFNLSSNENIFKHGVTFRLKYFHRQKNWQKNYPNRC